MIADIRLVKQKSMTYCSAPEETIIVLSVFLKRKNLC
uniref:Uncharacterized protein n=1 Tax=Anguilla anguilla TaxID=7936 RepID=A0A0E9W1Q0_ANGAN